jgi:hypothetical protein
MSKQFYYVLVATMDEQGNATFEMDPYTEEARFQDGSVWNDDTEEWEDYTSPENTEVSEKLTEILKHTLNLE